MLQRLDSQLAREIDPSHTQSILQHIESHRDVLKRHVEKLGWASFFMAGGEAHLSVWWEILSRWAQRLMQIEIHLNNPLSPNAGDTHETLGFGLLCDLTTDVIEELKSLKVRFAEIDLQLAPPPDCCATSDTISDD